MRRGRKRRDEPNRIDPTLRPLPALEIVPIGTRPLHPLAAPYDGWRRLRNRPTSPNDGADAASAIEPSPAQHGLVSYVGWAAHTMRRRHEVAPRVERTDRDRRPTPKRRQSPPPSRYSSGDRCSATGEGGSLPRISYRGSLPCGPGQRVQCLQCHLNRLLDAVVNGLAVRVILVDVRAAI
jgi:hypothetical protein